MKALTLFLLGTLVATSVVSAQETYGTIRATTKLRPDGSKSTTILDPDKHTAEETISDANNKVLRKTTYLLGENDIATGAIFYNAKGDLVYKATYTRDAAGRVAEAAFNASDGRYLGKRVFVYGANDSTQVIDYDANGQQIVQAQPVAPKAGKKRR